MDDENVVPADFSEGQESSEILTKPLPQILEEIERSIRLANEAAQGTKEAAEQARKSANEVAIKAEAVTKSAENMARQAREAGKAAAEEAMRRAEEAFRKAEEALKKSEVALPQTLVRRVVSSREFLAIIILVFMGAVFAGMSISLGLSLIGQ